MRARCGGHKKRHRRLNFRRDLGPNRGDRTGKVLSVQYDPNRKARIALMLLGSPSYNSTEDFSGPVSARLEYIVAPESLKVGSRLFVGRDAPGEAGNAKPLHSVSLGSFVHCVELCPGKGGQVARSAGTGSLLLGKREGFAMLRFPSKEIRLVDARCFATLGKVGNPGNSGIILGKAGRNRWFGRRPRVRGLAKNPVDHPHGGGEGRCGIGLPGPKTPWGKPALGPKTRNPKQKSSEYILRSRPRGKKRQRQVH
jgi:large subunit ribosomal protein L2